VAASADRCADQLFAPLAELSATGFSGLGAVADRGALLRSRCDHLLGVMAPPPEELLAWRLALERWEELEAVERALEVARGLRILRMQFGAPPKVARRRSASGGVGLEAATDSLPGIGPKLALRLADHGIHTVADLIWFLPRRYDDARRAIDLGEVSTEHIGQRVTVSGAVRSARLFRRGRRRWVDLRLAGGKRSVVVRWFGAHQSMADRFPQGAGCVLSGKLTERSGQLEMANPDVLEVITPDGERRGSDRRIIPRYRDLPGVPGATLRKAISAAVAGYVGAVVSALPASVEDELELPPLVESLEALHTPSEEAAADIADALNDGDTTWHRRLAIEELFVLAVVVALRRQACRADQGPPCPASPNHEVLLSEALPFTLTDAQRRVVGEIGRDLADAIPMNRLLQGDVGSGKTAVAFAAVLQVAGSGGQSAIMAPTEILAGQHFRTLKSWCDAVGLKVAMLTASTPKPVRSSTLALLAAGKIDVVVGTHALLAEQVAFNTLALVIIDEQHRFGVAQRAQLRTKSGGHAPHLLVMTATPIPRTLALTAYGDLDVSILDHLPPGRVPAETQVLSGRSGRAKAYAELRKLLAAGARGFLVCPMVEPGDESTSGWANTEEAAQGIATKWPEVRAAVVHGRMAASERDQAMEAFRAGTVQLLIATTVIEVGVDVPEASVMVIEDADRFGLSQLHQLRGRVGRGGGRARCLLIARGGPTAEGLERLQVMGESSDGFEIAEADLRIRGPGEILGARQAGLPRLRFGDLRRHVELLELARGLADELIAKDPGLEDPELAELARRVRTRDDSQVFGAEGG